MSDHEQADKFTNWAQQIALQPIEGNEGEVETKFVLPLFAHLGYPEGCRRDKFYAAAPHLVEGAVTQADAKSGKAYPDFVFFSTEKREEHDSSRALVVVEVKRSGEDLDKHLDQAKRYGDRLRSLFIVLTNGHRVKVLRRQDGGSEERLDDLLVADFKSRDRCLEFYERMNFETVRRVKTLTAEGIRYEHLLQLDKIVNADPELQEVLRKGDFKPYRAENEFGLIITKKKVSVSCILPAGQEEGGVRVEFSNPLRRSLAIHMSFSEFRRTMLVNLNTPPQWETRQFLRRLGDNMFDATLGSVTTTLSATEASDLCECIDEVAQLYKAKVIGEETLLETWDYEPTRIWGERSYRLITVSRLLWDLMKKFADEHDYAKGNTEWHIFSWNAVAVRVGIGPVDHVLLHPVSDESGRDYLPNGLINVFYNIPDWLYNSYNHFSALDRDLWQQSVGPKGIWTARYTKDWSLKKFIPKVLEYYRRDPLVKSNAAFAYRESSSPDWRPALRDVQDVKDLASYVQEVQGWLSGVSRNIPASLVREYYAALTNLIRNAALPADNYEYVWGNLSGVSRRSDGDREPYGLHDDGLPTGISSPAHDKVIKFLDEQVQRISEIEVENSSNAELLSRVFYWFLDTSTVRCDQQQLNAAKAVVSRLWEQYRFEARYVRSEV